MFGIDIVSNKMKRIMMFLLLCTMSFTVVQAAPDTSTATVLSGGSPTSSGTGAATGIVKPTTTKEEEAAAAAEAKKAEAAKEEARIANATVFSKLITSFGGLVFDGVVKINGAVVVIFLALSVISVYISMVFTPGASIEGIFSMILKRGINVTITTTIIAGWTVLIPESLIIWLKLGNIFGSGDNFKAEPGQGINGALAGAGSFLDKVWGDGTIATNELFATSTDLKNLLLILLVYFMIVILFFAYIYILTMITLAMLEYIFIGGLSIILLAFEGSEALKSISRKVINTILALGVKVLVTVAISTMAVREMGAVPIELLTPKDPDVLGVLTWVAKCLLLAYCCINLPKLVTSLLHGNGEAFSIQSLSKFAGSVGKAAAGGGGAALGAAGGALDGAMAGSEAAKLKGENPILGGLGGGAKGVGSGAKEGMQKTYDASNAIARFKQDPLGSIFRKNADSPDKQQKLTDSQKLDRLKAVEDKFGKDSPEWKEKAEDLFGKKAVRDEAVTSDDVNAKDYTKEDKKDDFEKDTTKDHSGDREKDTTKDHSGDREKDTTKDHSGDREQKIMKNAENMGEAGTGKSNGSNKLYDDLTKKPESKNIGGKSDEKEYRQYTTSSSTGSSTSTIGTSEKLSSLQKESVDKDTSPKSNDSSGTKDYTNKGDSLSSSSTQSSSSSDSKNTERESTITKNDYSKSESPSNSSSDSKNTNRETIVTKNEYNKAVAIEEKGAWNPSKSDRADKNELSKLKAVEDKNAWKDK